MFYTKFLEFVDLKLRNSRSRLFICNRFIANNSIFNAVNMQINETS